MNSASISCWRSAIFALVLGVCKRPCSVSTACARSSGVQKFLGRINAHGRPAGNGGLGHHVKAADGINLIVKKLHAQRIGDLLPDTHPGCRRAGRTSPVLPPDERAGSLPKPALPSVRPVQPRMASCRSMMRALKPSGGIRRYIMASAGTTSALTRPHRQSPNASIRRIAQIAAGSRRLKESHIPGRQMARASIQ